ncbi:hypothetical protein SAMN05216600_1462 [Pseudomonas cuatrocienegasensis]|uniref:Uncharacterized protein n=1 Tax=Pseudomonas cuatrocienegasensis TaxID=543360 RepID=A0ABY1BS14_9PSED|nr:hypothetical protein SAMN05216600_1462 [Pseudomonas cuatrocienegasensis]
MYMLQVLPMAEKIRLLRSSKMQRICAVRFVVTQMHCEKI